MSQAEPKRQIIWLNTIFLTVTPVLAIASTIYYGLEYGITWREVVAGLVIWSFTGLGITAGYHRLFAHKGYKAHKSVRFVLAVCGAAAIENSAIAWCSDHRLHAINVLYDITSFSYITPAPGAASTVAAAPSGGASTTRPRHVPARSVHRSCGSFFSWWYLSAATLADARE